MRYTAEKNPDVRTIPAGEIWIGIIQADRPYIALASKLDDDELVVICRFGLGGGKGDGGRVDPLRRRDRRAEQLGARDYLMKRPRPK